MAGNSSFKIKWIENPEYKCLSQIQNKFKAAACNVCIKDINISNIGGRVDLKVTLIYSGFSIHLILKEEFPAILWQKLQHAVFVCGSCHF
jgi:hypothetical protein